MRDPEDTDFQVDKGYDDGRWVWTGDTSDVAGKIKAIPNLPIVTMAAAEAKLEVVDTVQPAYPPYQGGSAASSATLGNTRERWNDYGIGLFLQGDLKAAQVAFSKVTEIEPTYLDGWVNIARCRIAEGDMQGAETMLEKAFEIQKTLPANNPHRAKVHYFYALVQEADGNYDTAIEHLRHAAAQFPRDTRVRNKLGRMYFLKRNYETALAEIPKNAHGGPRRFGRTLQHDALLPCFEEPFARREIAETLPPF